MGTVPAGIYKTFWKAEKFNWLIKTVCELAKGAVNGITGDNKTSI